MPEVRPVGQGSAARPVGGSQPVGSVRGTQITMPPILADDNRCKGSAKDGSRCKAFAVKGTALCYGHSRSQEDDADQG